MRRNRQPTQQEQEDALFATIEEGRRMASMLTGMRQAFIDAGWTEDGAEQVVIALVSR